jgi:chromosome segregation ATPase
VQPPHRSPRPSNAEAPHSAPAAPEEAPVEYAHDFRLELLLVRQRLGAVVESRRAAAAKLRACQRDNAKLHCELRERSSSYDRALAALEESRRADSAAAADTAAALQGHVQRLSAQVRHLRLSVAQLEDEVTGAASSCAEEPPCGEGAQLIGALQLEMAALQREAQAARRARAHAEQSRDALQQQADILRLQVEQMAERLDAQREENTELKLKAQALAQRPA